MKNIKDFKLFENGRTSNIKNMLEKLDKTKNIIKKIYKDAQTTDELFEEYWNDSNEEILMAIYKIWKNEKL